VCDTEIGCRNTSRFLSGYGMIQPCGHVDYFPNQGKAQPGCDKGPIDQLRIEGDIYNGGFSGTPLLTRSQLTKVSQMSIGISAESKLFA